MVKRRKNKSGASIPKRDQYTVDLEEIRSHNQFIIGILKAVDDRLGKFVA